MINWLFISFFFCDYLIHSSYFSRKIFLIKEKLLIFVNDTHSFPILVCMCVWLIKGNTFKNFKRIEAFLETKCHGQSNKNLKIKRRKKFAFKKLVLLFGRQQSRAVTLGIKYSENLKRVWDNFFWQIIDFYLIFKIIFSDDFFSTSNFLKVTLSTVLAATTNIEVFPSHIS